MDKKRWNAETLMRGEKAMSDLETFWGYPSGQPIYPGRAIASTIVST